MENFSQADQWIGGELLDVDGNSIGTIQELYRDLDTEAPEWAAVSTGLFGRKLTFVPLAGAEPQGEQPGLVESAVDVIRVPVKKDQVKDAPRVDPDGELSPEEEERLYRHYGMDYSFGPSASGLPADRGAANARAATPAEPDEAMTRSEEELRVGTASRERGRARLRKYVVTEEVEQRVPVRREEVRVEREPITDANVEQAVSGPEISEAEHEVVLHEEEPVVEKRAVPKERVRMTKDTETDEARIAEEVRKERVEAEGDEPKPRR
jgi:uncharacterized protein (TIGR02271 family)